MEKTLTNETVKTIVKKWADEKAAKGEIEFDADFCCEKFIRYRTTEMTRLIPDNDSVLKNWNRPFHYCYEIDCKQTLIRLQLAFNYENILDATRNICEDVLDKYRMYTLAEHDSSRGYFRRVCNFDMDIVDSTTEEEIFAIMDRLFYQMKGYETLIIYKAKTK